MSLTTETKPREDRAIKRSISFPLGLLEAAEEAAKAQGRSLSNYLQTLVRKDCGEEPEKKEAA